MMHIRNIVIVFALVLAPSVVFAQSASTTPASAYQFAADGILGCNQNGAYSKSVGAFSASGVYVPVSDAVVELNTGYLVYDKCVLSEMVDRLRDSALAGLSTKVTTVINTGRNGNPQYSTNINAERHTVRDTALTAYVQNGNLNQVNKAFRPAVRTAIVQQYYSQSQNPTGALACPYKGDLNAVLSGKDSSWEAFAALENPACNPLGAYQLASDQASQVVANVENTMMTQLQWGQGVYPTGKTDAYGNIITNTPGAVILNSLNQVITSGFRVTENANDIGQMTGALYAGLSAQVLSGSGGLAGITQNIAGRPSFMQQIGSAASKGVIQSVVNGALTILNSALQAEETYNQVITNIANSLTSAINNIRGQESTCWNLIIQNVCTATSTAMVNGQLTCTSPIGTALTVATSTVYSQAIINAQIAPLASSTIIQLKNSQSAISVLTRLIAQVGNSGSRDAQALAIDQLDTLTAQGVLHTPADLAGVQQQASAVQTTMTNLETNVTQVWGQGTPNPSNPSDPNSGWCNVANQSTIQMWETIWQK